MHQTLQGQQGGSSLWTIGDGTLLGVLLGALIAGSFALLASWYSARAERDRLKRADLRDLIAGYWADVDAHWSAQQKLAYAILEIQADRSNPRGEEARQQAFAQMRAVDPSARQRLALLRIIAPALGESAALLWRHSQSYMIEKSQTVEANRTSALQAFEKAAARVLVPQSRLYRARERIGHFKDSSSPSSD